MAPTTPLGLVLAAILILLTTSFLRLLYILPAFNRTPPKPRKHPSANGPPIHLLVVLGSGGHTAEMLSMLSNPHFSPETFTRRTYVASEGDTLSAAKAVEFEEMLMARQKAGSRPGGAKKLGYAIHTVPRARAIHQSLLTTPLSCITCLVASLQLLHNHPHGKPDLFLTNGPATALIIVLASLVLEYFSFLGIYRHGGGKPRTRSIYVESWARVKRPSLSCWIIVKLGLCHKVLVQWPQLEEAGWGEYRGVLVR